MKEGRKYWLSIIVGLLWPYFVLSQEVAINGYIKGMSTFSFLTRDIPKPIMDQLGLKYEYHDGLIHNRLNFNFYISEDWTAKIGMRNRIFYGFSASNIDGFSDLITADPGVLDMGILWLDAEGVKGYSNFDRAYINYETDDWQFRLGRQRINWGMNTVWNPNDLFNTYDYFDFDYEERPGSDAILVRNYLSGLESIEFGVSLDSDNKLIAAGLYKTNFRLYDIQFLGGYWKEDIALGTGFAGNIKNSGLKGEASYFIPTKNDSAYSFVASATYDYAFKNGLYVMFSFLYNSAAPEKLSFGDFTRFMAGGALLMSAKNPMPYRSVYFGQITYGITPLIFGGFATMITHGANDLFLIPTFTFSLMNDLDLDLVGQIFLGEQPYSKDFGMTSSSVFIRLKWSF
jgi:hypothetical protein